jgi:hypothetical protein
MNALTPEGNGLTVTFNDENNSIDFEWNPETHPHWNIIEEWGTKGLLKVLADAANETLESGTRTCSVSANTHAVIEAGHQEGWVTRSAIAAVIKILAERIVPERLIDIDDLPPYIEGCQDRQEEIRMELLNIAFELIGTNE